MQRLYIGVLKNYNETYFKAIVKFEDAAPQL